MRRLSMFAAAALAIASLIGCSHPQPVTMAPPIGGQPGGQPVASSAGVYDWHDVPQGQQVPVQRAVFDQGGYQIYAASGETIVVPFANQNLYVMKFGRSNNGSTYFVNDGNAPILFLRNGDSLENASAQGARWYPISPDYNYTQPMYVSIAPSWNEYVGMGWYPNMVMYGGMWSYRPYASSFVWMPGYYYNIGGRRYNSYTVYRNYYTTNRGYTPLRSTFNYSAPRSTGSFSSGRSFGSGRTTGSFGSGRSALPGSTGSFGSGRSNNGRSSGGSGSGSFGSGRAATSGSFGGKSGFGSTTRSSGSSFGSGKRSSGGSFGGGSTRSGGSSSFGSGGSTRSSGSFGGGSSTRSSGSFGRRR